MVCRVLRTRTRYVFVSCVCLVCVCACVCVCVCVLCVCVCVCARVCVHWGITCLCIEVMSSPTVLFFLALPPLSHALACVVQRMPFAVQIGDTVVVQVCMHSFLCLHVHLCSCCGFQRIYTHAQTLSYTHTHTGTYTRTCSHTCSLRRMALPF